MSSERNSSAVRNLRSIFENKAQEEPTSSTRGRSPIGELGSCRDSTGGSPLPKVRASFVSVDRSGHMAVRAASDLAESGKESRRSSGNTNEDASGSTLWLNKDTRIKPEQKASIFGNGAAASGSATNSPAAKPTAERAEDQAQSGKSQDASKLSKTQITELDENKPPASPDKSTNGAETEVGALKSADPTSQEAVSGGVALPARQEDLRKPDKANGIKPEDSSVPDAQADTAKSASRKPPGTPSNTTTSNAKPSSVSTKSDVKVPASLKSPASVVKSPVLAKQRSPKPEPTRVIDRKASRSSLTAPTAASVARAASSEKRESLPHNQAEPSAKPRPREPTKVADVSSRLLAPTAASRAKHDAESKAVPSAQKSTTAHRPKPPTASAKPTPRSSLVAPQRPDSRASQSSSRRPTAPPDGSFLDRMTRPTAASTSRVHDKAEVKSPPRKSAVPPTKRAPASKTNGVAKAGAKVVHGPKDLAAKVAARVTGEEHADEASYAGDIKTNGVNHSADEEGNATPVPVPGEQSSADDLESTPAFGEQEIR